MTRLDGWSNPDARVDADGVRLPSTKYARRAVPRRDDARGAARAAAAANVTVPFAGEPTALREFLWGLAVGFADLASLVRSAVTSDRTVLDKLPYRDVARVPAAGVVDAGPLERVLAARERGAFSRPPGPRLAPRPRRESAAKGLAVVTAINAALLWAGANAPTEPR